MNMKYFYRPIWIFAFLLITVSGCGGPTEVNPSDQFIIPSYEIADIENKIRNLDCEAFDKLMMHYDMGGVDYLNKRKYWLDFAMNKPMRDCTAQSANFYADLLLNNAQGIDTIKFPEKISDKYNMLMEAWHYAEHGYGHAKPENIESAQGTINEINLELWKLRKGEFKNAVVK
jgi:hypothetical protein